MFSGQINLSQRFAWICRWCGECGWSEDYVLSQVNHIEYQRLRVAHGWGAPVRLPAPPRVPTNLEPTKPDHWIVAGVVWFATLAACFALSMAPWDGYGPVLKLWQSMLGAGLSLGVATLLYVIWKTRH